MSSSRRQIMHKLKIRCGILYVNEVRGLVEGEVDEEFEVVIVMIFFIAAEIPFY
jgi:hypothetical protein